jgi:Ras-related protein Rab-5C
MQGVERPSSFKVVLFGPPSVGKTCLIAKFHRNEFLANATMTIGSAFVSHPVVTGGDTVNLNIWDTAGQEQFAKMTAGYFRDAHAAIAVYDASAPSTADVMENQIADYFDACQNTAPILVLSANKGDALTPDEAEANLAKLAALETKYKAKGFQTSAKTGELVQEMFEHVARALKESGALASQNLLIERDPGDKGKCPC